MFPQMRRIVALPAARRAVGGVAAADQHHRLFQAALFSASSNNSSARSHWFTFNGIAGEKPSRAAAHAVFGTMLFSTAATAIVGEVHAKESVKFRPNDVVLYQYEACPFCNKVKGIWFRFWPSTLLWISFIIHELYILNVGIAIWIRLRKRGNSLWVVSLWALF